MDEELLGLDKAVALLQRNAREPAKAFERVTEVMSLPTLREDWIMLYNKKPMSLRGKCRWKAKNHVMAALTNAWSYDVAPGVCWRSDEDYVDCRQKFKDWCKENLEIVKEKDYLASIE